MRSKRIAGWTLGLLAIGVAAMLAAWAFVPIAQWAAEGEIWIAANPVAGALVFFAVFILAAVTMAPVWPLNILGGIAFGIAAGFPLVLVSAVSGAIAAFFVARLAGRERFAKLIAGRRLARSIDEAIGEGGFKVVFLLRLNPALPYNLQNYLYGISSVRPLDHIAATAVGLIPTSLMYVWIGSLGRAALTGDRQITAWEWGLYGVGLVALIAAVFIVGRLVKARLAATGVDLDAPGGPSAP